VLDTALASVLMTDSVTLADLSPPLRSPLQIVSVALLLQRRSALCPRSSRHPADEGLSHASFCGMLGIRCGATQELQRFAQVDLAAFCMYFRRPVRAQALIRCALS
jgi:hypothetical protein